MFCSKCGKEVNDEAVVCIHCGCAIPHNNNNNNSNTNVNVKFGGNPSREEKLASGQYKSKRVFWVLGVLLGYFGIHRFYIKSNGWGTFYLLFTILTLGLGGGLVWICSLVDCATIDKTKDGKPLI